MASKQYRKLKGTTGIYKHKVSGHYYAEKRVKGVLLTNTFTHLHQAKAWRVGIPIDNNSQERLMRNPVFGRKTWYGTHSKKGVETNARLFSLVESCKINKINPREYFKDIVHAIHEKRPIFTPSEYKKMKSENPA